MCSDRPQTQRALVVFRDLIHPRSQEEGAPVAFAPPRCLPSHPPAATSRHCVLMALPQDASPLWRTSHLDPPVIRSTEDLQEASALLKFSFCQVHLQDQF